MRTFKPLRPLPCVCKPNVDTAPNGRIHFADYRGWKLEMKFEAPSIVSKRKVQLIVSKPGVHNESVHTFKGGNLASERTACRFAKKRIDTIESAK